MNTDFFQSQDPLTNISVWKPVIALFILFFATFVGVEIRLGKDEEKP